MKAQTKHFDERVFESVTSGGVDFYKVTSLLVNIIETSEKTEEKSSGRLVGGLVVNDTIYDTISDTIYDIIYLLLDNKHTGFDEMQVQIMLNLAGLCYEY